MSLTAIRVSDLRRSVEFYTEGCGFTHERDLHMPSFLASIVRGGVAGLELVSPIDGETEARVDHGNMFIKTVVNVDSVERRMTSACVHGGVEVTPLTHLANYGMIIGSVRDPDGYLVEFVERTQAR
ncbi:VOC family protein [Rhodococcus sp. (in: high G+C Gram-positive bacteria)]|uniref:VOC family protein n=1 Tax=Rhodococcus sp. TaxID=1831 RepID=UPI00257A0366|nr:VOC family protein [Rhodococcus sp. (in: high G+C Gram-positive bacteria)]